LIPPSSPPPLVAVTVAVREHAGLRVEARAPVAAWTGVCVHRPGGATCCGWEAREAAARRACVLRPGDDSGLQGQSRGDLELEVRVLGIWD
jgi:hypothetical protein